MKSYTHSLVESMHHSKSVDGQKTLSVDKSVHGQKTHHNYNEVNN